QHVDHIIRVTMEGNSDVQDAVEAVIGERLGCELAEIERSEEGVQVAYRVSGRAKHWKELPERLLDVDGVERVVRG
ncbi:MAG: hypothetical protein R3314_06090, partial [Longimicrobiales bacterium]|nr:hypothetical protein [Longimicrobiales bacterium]